MINDVFHFTGNDATKYGLVAAVILYNLKFWVKKNKENERNLKDGFYWTYNSVKAFQKQLPFLSKGQIERALKELEEKEVIKSGVFNDNNWLRTKWYTVLELGKQEVEVSQIQEMHFSNLGNGISQIQEMEFLDSGNVPYTDINTDLNLQIISQKNRHTAKVVPDNVLHLIQTYSGIRKHNATDNNIKLIQGKLKKLLRTRSLDEIITAIQNYQKAIDSGVIQYIWDLWEFLGHEKAEKYYAENFKIENYQKRSLGKSQLASQANMRLAQELGLIDEEEPPWTT